MANKVTAKKTETVTKKVPAKKTETVAKKAPDDSPTERKKAQPVTVESYQELCNTMIESIEAEIERLKSTKDKGVKFLKNIRRNVTLLRDRAPKLAKQKRKKSENAKSGLKIPQNVSDELCTFLKVKPGTQISRVDATRGITAYIHLKDNESRNEILQWKNLNPGGKRNLQDSNDATIINPDDALKKLLNYDQYVKNVKAGLITKKKDGKTVKEDDPSLHYYTIQKLIKHHFLGNNAENV